MDRGSRTRIERAADGFRRRHFAAETFTTGREAVERFFATLGTDETIGHGGSDTLRELGVLDRLAALGPRFLNRYAFGPSYEEQLDIRRRNLAAGVFVASSNAASVEGALVNVDGDGNRVAALAFGPRRVVLFVGRNKLCDDLDQAIHRARHVAAPRLAARLGVRTPCATTGTCHDCASPERICSYVSIIDHCNPPERISIYLIDEDLGL